MSAPLLPPRVREIFPFASRFAEVGGEWTREALRSTGSLYRAPIDSTGQAILRSASRGPWGGGAIPDRGAVAAAAA